MGKKINFRHNEPSPVSDICWECAHFNGKNPAARTCLAFPKGIPNEIWEGKNNHTASYPGDKGIQFEPILKRAA